MVKPGIVPEAGGPCRAHTTYNVVCSGLLSTKTKGGKAPPESVPGRHGGCAVDRNVPLGARVDWL